MGAMTPGATPHGGGQSQAISAAPGQQLLAPGPLVVVVSLAEANTGDCQGQCRVELWNQARSQYHPRVLSSAITLAPSRALTDALRCCLGTQPPGPHGFLEQQANQEVGGTPTDA